MEDILAPDQTPAAAFHQDLINRFTFHPVQTGQPTKYTTIRSEAFEFAEKIARLAPAGRERSLAITKLEEVVFWSNAAIAREASK